MFFLQISANFPHPQISSKTWHDFYLLHEVSEYKIRKFLFFNHKSISSFVHITSIMPGIKEVNHFTKTASSDSKSEDLHDDTVYIVRTPTKVYDSFKERMEILPLNHSTKHFKQIHLSKVMGNIRYSF